MLSDDDYDDKGEERVWSLVLVRGENTLEAQNQFHTQYLLPLPTLPALTSRLSKSGLAEDVLEYVNEEYTEILSAQIVTQLDSSD